ncbi:tRNA (adenosine(37)-N6)-threonylcarbamoyltransferase complex ATPase subunit type 1 TsaE [Alkalilimnicola sp. S0819]|uniref:tRNA (adenosine(37)-N6)-threonylcarbamoyltransferase complex ATPase subunit type 1 TsaE n=1 Tax=Alkalilimnicola sp. S0819 TaxID=2613922 RepID=UPI0012621817|nr:tRNA (adenosine(37)-N6)-threonylcarbamoyltransferase complex ATPase subunit type 1 TsaE [Alkalilimnicola sp. S0819]KAB7628349.1 tRNA (adenosine(37)-N6)-threonylcarbamoyltransferase complex ATPase subunit type 1 TsaE [Alkalilimnicola sp. S0819]MPQ15250.1 tRNA (adenosine(37)-N6)-threonylcarbamoyltransferase complex ATPase subunit type 1 TsaE [Alkalilimnicola sp. S0819]
MSDWLQLANEARTAEAGAALWRALEGEAVVYLHGDLGAGKTTLVRGLLRAAGHAGAVRSPTYTLVEPYEVAGRAVYHLDLYRLADPEELEFIGLRDLLARPALWLVEWPQRGEGMLPAADLRLELHHQREGRGLRVEAGSGRAEAAAEALRRQLGGC